MLIAQGAGKESTMVMQGQVESVIERVGDLPAMPDLVAEVLRITELPGTAMNEVSEVIENDPAMTAKILRVSNSGYYGMRQYVGTLKLALVILGVREVRNIVLGISVFDSLQDQNVSMKTAHHIWNFSLRVASIAKKLGNHMGLGLQGEDFISGLLSDIGKMVLLRQNGHAYEIMLNDLEKDAAVLCAREMERYDCTHVDVGVALAVRWNLPKTLIDALWCQYKNMDRPIELAKDPQLAAVVRIAKRTILRGTTSARGIGAADQEAWACLSRVKNPIAEDERDDIVQGFLDEVRKTPMIPL